MIRTYLVVLVELVRLQVRLWILGWCWRFSVRRIRGARCKEPSVQSCSSVSSCYGKNSLKSGFTQPGNLVVNVGHAVVHEAGNHKALAVL